MECLNDIIGVTNSFCNCFNGNLTPELIAKMKVSKSGLYLDGLEGGILLRNVAQLDKCKSFVEMQFEAIEEAKKVFVKDAMRKLTERFKSSKKNFIGDIGRMGFTQTLNTSQRLQFFKLKAVSDGILKINRIRIIANIETDSHYWIVGMNNGDTLGEVITEGDFQTSEGNFVNLNIEAELPLLKNDLYQTYFIVWESNGASPRDTKYSCGCPSGNGFEDYLDVSGGEASDFTQLNSVQSDVFTHGIIIEAELKCGLGNLICNEFKKEEAIPMSVAYAIRFKAGELLIENILNSGEVNRYTMLANERLWGKRNHFIAKYEEHLGWSTDMMDISSSDCFICRESKMIKTYIES